MHAEVKLELLQEISKEIIGRDFLYPKRILGTQRILWSMWRGGVVWVDQLPARLNA